MKKFGGPEEDDAGTGSQTAAAPQPDRDQRVVSHVDVLKALADPLRLNMLYALTRERGPEPPAKTVKELAAELGEPQTKLYRHIKHLESAGLIHAVASRVVSGIVEHRYQASQADMIMGDDLTDTEKVSPEAEAMAAAALELYRRQFFAARRAQPSGQADAEPHRRMVMAVADGRVPAARAAEIYDLLYQLLDDVAETNRDGRSDDAAGEMVSVNLLIGYFAEDSQSN